MIFSKKTKISRTNKGALTSAIPKMFEEFFKGSDKMEWILKDGHLEVKPIEK